MSVVTTMILTCMLGEATDEDQVYAPLVERMSDWLEERSKGRLTEISTHFGGHKGPQMMVFGGAFNCLDLDEFMAALRALPWYAPESVQVFVNTEHSERFVEVTQGHLVNGEIA